MLNKTRLRRLDNQIQGLSAALLSNDSEPTLIVALGILNDCGLVRPDWRERGADRIIHKRQPILYTSHFQVEEGLLPEHLEMNLYVLLTYLIQFVCYDDASRHERIHPLYHQTNRYISETIRQRHLPLLVSFWNFSMADTSLTPENCQMLEEAAKELKKAVELFREGSPPA